MLEVTDLTVSYGAINAVRGVSLRLAEGELVTLIQEARINKASGIVINPAAYTHTSVAIMDALALTELPVIEIHITNVHQRESFRHHSYVSKVARGVLAGFGIQGYALAIEGLAGMIGAKER